MPRDLIERGNAQRVIVVGSGFGGIAAALRMRRLGYDVLLLERQPRIGGRARVFSQDGFTFDAGPTVITAPQLFEELFALFGERMADHVELLPVRPWYRILFRISDILTTAALPRKCGLRSRRSLQLISPATTGSCAARRRCSMLASTSSGRNRSTRSALWRGSARTGSPRWPPVRILSRAWLHPGLVIAARVQSAAPASRRTSIPDIRHLCANTLSRAALGGVVPSRRDRRHG